MAKPKSGAGVGIHAGDLAPQSLMRLERFSVVKPKAATANAIVTSVAVNGLVVGANLTLALAGRLRNARRITVTQTDASFSAPGLSTTVIIRGHRFGIAISEEVTLTSTNTSPITGTTAKYFDEVTSVTLKAKSGDAASDTMTVGIGGQGFGLPYPIDNVSDVLMIYRNTSGVEAPVAVSASTVDKDNSAIIGLTVLAADDYEIEFLRSRRTDGFRKGGVF